MKKVMKISTYLARLKPIGNYFFGNERYFKFINEENQDNRNKAQNYIVSSNLLPQQTTLLGMLRKEILIQSDCYKQKWGYSIEDKVKIKKLIGPSGFKIDEEREQYFGVIESISQIYTYKDNCFYTIVPKDHIIHDKKKDKEKVIKKVNEYYTPFKTSVKERVRVSFNLYEKNIPVLQGYDPKDGLSNDWMDISNGKIVPFGEIFATDKRIGIEKGEAGKTKEDSLFKTISYRLKNNYEFAFFINLSDEMEEDLKRKFSDNFQTIVYMGADQTAFKLTISPSQKEEEKRLMEKYRSLIKKDNVNKVVLLSDTYVDHRIYDDCDFAITETIDFRNIYVIHDKECEKANSRLKKIDKKYCFIKRGSVFYTSDVEKLLNHINQNRNLIKIGYNIAL
ncbi:hypothetical protein GND95_09375 [Defluviitalea raffinosedens]|uniref:Uncharacterized protein n=2 Tax=Defluviitalea TaxID=1185408 RepID=A0A7C8LCW5_9FIRM|nr:hypothetical protein GND95_09375 [Defluviitalea raffinosedens]